MEATLGEQTAVGFSAGTEGPEHRQELEASDEAVTFMSGIEPAELQKCVFADSLVTVSEGGRELGEFSVTVEFARREQPCMMLHAQSHGAIDDCPCGTAVTAYLTTDLQVLEEDHHEYVKLEGHSVDKRCHMVQRDGLMVIHKVTTRELGQRQLEVGGELLDVFGVERIIQSMEGSPSTWQCYFLDDGHLVTRVQVGSPVTMRLLELPSKAEKDSVIFKIPLVWEEDMQMRSKFLDRKEELKADHSSYLRQHPEIRALISDFLQLLLLRKPDDVFLFAREYFTPFTSNHPADADQEAQSL
uniref:Ciliogenesis-associated TTC17-interacting protein n=1 Tax=Pundamilia nyererei TaxID=303518 RepID=A0A3B4GK08_9CICH